MGRTETDEVIERIEWLLADSKPVPLTKQVRLDPKEVQALLEELRQALADERRG